MPSPCAAARSCSPAPEAKTPTRSLTSWDAIRKLPATPYTLSTRRDFRRHFGKAPNVRIPFTGLPGSRTGRGFAGAFAPQTQEVRQTHECVDAGSRRRGELRRGPHEGADNWRDRPGYFGAIGSALGAGKALDHFPRSGVPKKKRRRDRLIGLSEGRSEWVVGFLDETWWSRLARPALNSWSDAGEPLRLIEQSVAKDDPDPKAISCYGLHVPEFEKVWVRFVDGRPVSSIT